MSPFPQGSSHLSKNFSQPHSRIVKNRLLYLILGAAFALNATNATAQLLPDPLDPPAHVHANVTAPRMIDGARHPDLIPDGEAYRLYFVAMSEMPNPTEEQKARQLSHLKKAGLENDDLLTTIRALEEFKIQYNILSDQYNASAEAADKSWSETKYCLFSGPAGFTCEGHARQISGIAFFWRLKSPRHNCSG